MKQRPDFPAVWDNSMRKVFKLCPKKFEYEFIKRYRPMRFSQHLQGGMAFAHGMEVARKAFYQEGLTHEDAVVKGWLTVASDYSTYESLESDVKTASAMSSALAYYFSVWRMDQDFVIPYNFGNGNLGLEFSFALPLDVLHPVTGQPLLYYGRMDMLGERENGTVWIVDEKTASRLGTSWVEGWALDSQFTGYCWAVREYGLKVHGAIIRGVSILSSGHGHAQSLQPRPDWMVQRWKEQLERDIKKAILMWDDGFFDYDLADGCKSYGGCPFKNVCQSNQPGNFLQADFVKSEYAPWNLSTTSEQSSSTSEKKELQPFASLSYKRAVKLPFGYVTTSTSAQSALSFGDTESSSVPQS